MRFTISIDCDNAAFDDPGELTRILTDLGKRLEWLTLDEQGGTLRDLNGNTVGKWEIQ